MNPYTRYEIELHEAGLKLQESLPSYIGLKIQQLEKATGWSWGKVCAALDELEKKGKAESRRTENGNRCHGTIRFKGRIRYAVRKSA